MSRDVSLRRRLLTLAAAGLSLITNGRSPGQGPPEAAGRPAPALPAASCATLLGDVDPAGAASASNGIRRRRALLVGISKYMELGSKNGMWNSLRTGCDVELMRQVLMARFGFRDGDIRTLTESQATKQELDKAFREHLINGAGPGDVVVFYFSGHGQSVADPEAFGGLRGSLVTANYTTGRGLDDARQDNLRSDEVRELLRALKENMKDKDGKVQGNITVLFDSCHSGNGTKGELQEKGRPWDPARDGGEIPQPNPGLGAKGEAGTKGSFSDFDRDKAIAEGYTFISACRNYQVAYCPQAGTEASVFTYHLARGMADATPGTTYKDLFERLSVDISLGQIPQLEGDSTKLLLAGAAVPGEEYLVVQAIEGKRITLPVGFVQGVATGSRYALYRAGKKVREEANKLGEARVVKVATTTCTAELEGPGTDAVKPEELKAARAVELERAFGRKPLYVFFDGVKRPEAELRPHGMLASTTEDGRPVTKDNCHVRVRVAGTFDPKGTGKELLVDPATGKEVLAPGEGKPKLRPDWIWLQQSDNNFVLSEFPADDEAAETIRKQLLGMWQKRYLAEYLKRGYDPNQSINVELIIEAVMVEEDEIEGTKFKGVRTDASQAGTLQLIDGDYIRVSVHNKSRDVPVFVTVLHIGQDGVFPIYPVKDAPNADLAANRIEPSKTPFPLPFFLRMAKPYGMDLYKVIATTEPADFSKLLYQAPLPPGSAARGQAMGSKGDALKKVPPELNPLALLLDEVKDGSVSKGAETRIVGTKWATAEKYVEVLPPKGK